MDFLVGILLAQNQNPVGISQILTNAEPLVLLLVANSK
jgi:hypothetical protein